jgi:hypothetical protein
MATNSRSKYSNEQFEQMVTRMRSWLTGLARRRSSRVVTADDVHSYLDRQGVSNRAQTRLRFINSVLREPTFYSTGMTTTSTRPVAKGRAITEWTV